MSSTVLRIGLWIIVIVLAAYVVHESYEDSPLAERIPMDLLQKALVLGGVVLAAGIVLRFFEKSAKAVLKNRCRVCRTPIASGALYCRDHLRTILHEEDERTHATKIRR
jgi:hypothetical protein